MFGKMDQNRILMVPQKEKCLEREQHERKNHIDKIVLLHSVGGGTGSGLGSRLLESLSDHFPELPLVACSVLPFLSCSDNSLQAYNTVFSLGWMQDFAAGGLLFENDHASSSSGFGGPAGGTGAQSAPNSASTKSDAFKQLNQQIAGAISGTDFDDFLAYSVPTEEHKDGLGGALAVVRAATLSCGPGLRLAVYCDSGRDTSEGYSDAGAPLERKFLNFVPQRFRRSS